MAGKNKDFEGCDLEYAQMRKVLGSDAEVWKTLQHQFGVIHHRIQTLFTLGALAITVTGFSGHRMVAAGPWSGIPLVIGLVIVMAGLLVALYGFSRLRWISTYIADNPEESFCRIIAARNQKTRAFRTSLKIVLIGLCFYVLAIANYLIQASTGQMPLF
ncbi:hypothetical protein [Desulfohalovibrio reitneri]|uniref:hypothetical protein n=1 Tax=Desulfohalovibrio reitneri TaxID=1307759 RepID=UPI00068B9FAB|nr:hypothetical protein [Desulfohalovibrio reitneri]